MWPFMFYYNKIVIKRHAVKYISLDLTGSIIHVQMDDHFVDMSFTQASVFRNLNFVAAG